MMLRAVIATLAAGLGALLVWVMLDLPAPPGQVPALVAANLNASGVAHPVTAVLLNFRGYDTLLEIGVLLLAVLGVLAVAAAAGSRGAAFSETAAAAPKGKRSSLRSSTLRPSDALIWQWALAAADTGGPQPAPAGPVLRALANLVVPLMVLVAGYLLWAGAHRPGGAFQAGAVLAAAGVLLRLSGRLPALLPPRFWLRAGLLAGFAVFLAVALGVAASGAALLAYPAGQAGALILLIEAALTVSIGLILISLFVGAPTPPAELGAKRP